jgi:hypothetical protein
MAEDGPHLVIDIFPNYVKASFKARFFQNMVWVPKIFFISNCSLCFRMPSMVFHLTLITENLFFVFEIF